MTDNKETNTNVENSKESYSKKEITERRKFLLYGSIVITIIFIIIIGISVLVYI